MIQSVIIINVTGTLKLDDTTIVTNPIVTITNTNDNYILNSVSTTSIFTSDTENYQFSRPTGTFEYIETWSDEDVRTCVEEWIDEHLMVVE